MLQTFALLTLLAADASAAAPPTVPPAIAIVMEHSRPTADPRKIVHDVRRAYYELQQTGANLRSAREIAALYRDLASITEAYARRRMVLDADLVQTQVRLAQAEQREAELLQRQTAAAEHVKRLLDRAAATGIDVQPLAEAADDYVPLAAAQQRALARACDRLAEREGRAGHDGEASVLSDVDERHRELRRSRARLEFARMQREAAIESLRLTRNRYVLDPSLIKDALLRQIALEERQSDYQQFRASLDHARAGFARAVGE